MEVNKLPFGSGFSPSQIDLITVLEIARSSSGLAKLEAAIRKKYVDRKKGLSEDNAQKLAMNTRLGMQKYGVITHDCSLSEIGEKLLSLKGDSAALYEEMSRHILLKLNGIALVTCIQDMESAGERVNATKLREWLGERGISVPRGGTHANIMRLWLEKSGVFTGGWRINQQCLEKILGVDGESIEALLQLSPEQTAFLKTIANSFPEQTIPSNQVERLATATYGVKFNEKMLPSTVLYPLEKAGFITLTRGTKASGRGAKPFMIATTKKFDDEVLLPLLEQSERLLNLELRKFMRKPLKDILKELQHKDKHIKGLALEALAIKIMRLVDLDYVKTRLRGTRTGGAEVDVIFQSTRLSYCRWQVQCKNTSSVSLDDVAKEVGLTHVLKSNVIVMITTGEIGVDARHYADSIMRDSNLCIIMVNKQDIEAIKENPVAIVDIFTRESKHAMVLKPVIDGGET